MFDFLLLIISTFVFSSYAELNCPSENCDLLSNDLSKKTVNSWQECGSYCKSISECKQWTYSDSTSTCYAKNAVDSCTATNGLTSGSRHCPRKRQCYKSGPEMVGWTLKSSYMDHTNGGSGKWNQCESMCREDEKCNSWMGRNSGNTCLLSVDTELKDMNTGGLIYSDNHPYTFGYDICTEIVNVNRRIDKLIDYLQATTSAHGSGGNYNVYDNNGDNKSIFDEFVFTKIELLLLCTNLFTIIMLLFVCWRTGVFCKNNYKAQQYAKVEYTDSNVN